MRSLDDVAWEVGGVAPTWSGSGHRADATTIALGALAVDCWSTPADRCTVVARVAGQRTVRGLPCVENWRRVRALAEAGR